MGKERASPTADRRVLLHADENMGDDGPMARILAVMESVSAMDRPVSLRDVEQLTALPKATGVARTFGGQTVDRMRADG